ADLLPPAVQRRHGWAMPLSIVTDAARIGAAVAHDAPPVDRTPLVVAHARCARHRWPARAAHPSRNGVDRTHRRHEHTVVVVVALRDGDAVGVLSVLPDPPPRPVRAGVSAREAPAVLDRPHAVHFEHRLAWDVAARRVLRDAGAPRALPPPVLGHAPRAQAPHT